jgi:hypothetical protein
MWPQSSLEEAEEAQRLADAGDPRYTWQVLGPVSFNDPRQTEFITRFLQEELGWEEFDLSGFPGLYAGVPDDRPWEFLAVRCAPGQTNPLYPNDPQGRRCAPTIDEYRYETVMINAEPPFRVADDPSAIWVVSRWATLQPSDVQVTGTHYRDDNGESFRRQVQQVVPPSDAEATALLESFLQARVDGEGPRNTSPRGPADPPPVRNDLRLPIRAIRVRAGAGPGVARRLEGVHGPTVRGGGEHRGGAALPRRA